MVVKLHVFNIKFSDRCSVISVTGPYALGNWLEPKYINAYGKHYADIKNVATMPTEVDIQLEFNFTKDVLLDKLDQVEYKIKQWLEEKSELDVITFNYVIVT
jgi:hypothetical protein